MSATDDARALADVLDVNPERDTDRADAAAMLRNLAVRIDAADALIHEPTFGELLARDVDGFMLPQIVMMDDLRHALHPDEET